MLLSTEVSTNINSLLFRSTRYKIEWPSGDMLIPAMQARRRLPRSVFSLSQNSGTGWMSSRATPGNKTDRILDNQILVSDSLSRTFIA